ncbi:regulatory factor X-associated protein [Corythoichthys intestinalis]|uniref:regulatory factor X-associated protein n=1 Tax=Corythoichthys intestinalis TaxID=161448 RepID=UPI0025A51687|nr:regulatory factor X-associated protein [Corythoichthys intestinalis]XP_061801153.1 regulatory factor X-associated protein-like [Nerophis lumbriciformis]
MSDDETALRKDSSKAILLTKDGQRYIVGDSRSVDSRDVITLIPMENADLMELDDADEESDVLDTSDARDGAVSPEELNDDEASEGDGAAPKQCTYDGCTETTTQVAKQRKPWMCKKHRNKMYKDKYKKKKSDQAMSTNKIDDNCEERPVSVNKQRLGVMGDRPVRPSLIEQVLNQKRLSLLRSPEVIHFLQQQQNILATQSRGLALQHNFSGC